MMGAFRRLWAMAMAVLLLAATMTAGSCADYSSCGACRNTTVCHWCPDQQCHAIGSIHGCFSGTYCYNNNQCQRKLPEFRGYAAPSIAVLIGVFLVGSTAFVCGVAAISIAREYAKESAASRESAAIARAGGLAADPSPASALAAPTRRGRGEYMTIAGGDDSGALVDDPSAEEEGQTDAASTGARKKTRTAGGGEGSARLRTHRVPARRSEAPGPSPLARKVVRFTQIICGTGMVGALAMCAMVIAFAPHTPGVNVCNTEFDWGSIVHSLAKIGLEADFQILVSIYNPNVLDAKIETGTAVLYHKHTEVGTMAFEPALLEGGYVTDILLTISFDAEASEDAKLGLEYETGQLAFLMDASVSASVMWHGFKTYPFTFSISKYYIKVSDTTDYDRSLCNCTQMMQGARRPLPTDGANGKTWEGRGATGAAEVLLPQTMGETDRMALQ